MLTLGEIAALCDARVVGDPACEIHAVNSLDLAGPDELSFVNGPRFRKQLPQTRAAAVILQEVDLESCPCDALVVDDPYLSYARVAARLHPEPRPDAGVHPSAVIDATANISPLAIIGPQVSVGRNVRVADGAWIGPGCVILDDSEVGADCRLVANVVIGPRVRMGRECLIQPGAVIGGRGFGLASDGGRWVEVPQLGGVLLGDRVEVGACTTIDRGALKDTLIHDGVKLDNLIMVGHNVEVGENTAMAALVGIAGSTTIGADCTLAGMVGISGHLEIVDNVHLAARSGISHNIREPGVYAGGIFSLPYQEWRRSFSKLRHLDSMYKRLRALEAQVGELSDAKDDD